jgi:hypothetical protein
LIGAAEHAAGAPIIHPNASDSVTPEPTVNPAGTARPAATAFTKRDYGE